MTKLPKISILVATDDHPPDLDLFFGALVNQTLPPEDYEVIVIDSSRTHDYEPAVRKCLEQKNKKLRLEFEAIEKGGRASAYNRGLALSRAPVILFFGDDYLAAEKTAEVHLQFQQENKDLHAVGIGSAILPKKLRTRFSTWLEESGELYGVPFSSDMTAVPEDFFYIGNSSVKREFLNSAGIFDEDFPYHAWDDYELGLRLSENGMKSTFLPDAQAEHIHDIPLSERARIMLQAGECGAIFEKKYEGRHPWHRKCEVPLWLYKLREIGSLIAFGFTRQEKFIVSYYKAHLNSRFLTGYQKAGGKIS